MESLNIDIQFSLHEKTNRLILQVVDQPDGIYERISDP
jgi:uncharacterized FlaG/YvyC family protein